MDEVERFENREKLPKLTEEFITARKEFAELCRRRFISCELKEIVTDEGVYVEFHGTPHAGEEIFLASELADRDDWVDSPSEAQKQHVELYKKLLEQKPEKTREKKNDDEPTGRDSAASGRLGRRNQVVPWWGSEDEPETV